MTIAVRNVGPFSEVAGRTITQIILAAEQIGLSSWPVSTRREPGGLWIHRYRRAEVRA